MPDHCPHQTHYCSNVEWIHYHILHVVQSGVGYIYGLALLCDTGSSDVYVSE